MSRPAGWSVRLKLTLSYAGFLLVAGGLLLGAVWLFLLRGQADVLFIPHLSDFARALNPRNFGVRAFVPSVIMVLAFLLVFGLAGGWFLAGRLLAPLTHITTATRRAAVGSLSHRIDMDGHNDEFRELADSFDAMLGRLQAHVDEQQRFAANASHELRTPMAIMQTLLDLARADPNRVNPELVDTLHNVNTRAIALTEALLLLSQADQASFTRELVDLSLIAEEAEETLLPLAERNGITIETTGDSATVLGSHALLLQLTTNLVHNAITHNRTDGGFVWITTGVEQGRCTLTVENTGDTVQLQSIPTLAEPFQRGTQRVHTAQSGVGLGLAIVQRICDAHNGTLVLNPRASGGLRAAVALPTTSVTTRT